MKASYTEKQRETERERQRQLLSASSLQNGYISNTGPGQRQGVWGFLQIPYRVQEPTPLAHLPTGFPGTLPATWSTSRAASLQTAASIGCWWCRWQLCLLHHSPGLRFLKIIHFDQRQKVPICFSSQMSARAKLSQAGSRVMNQPSYPTWVAGTSSREPSPALPLRANVNWNLKSEGVKTWSQAHILSTRPSWSLMRFLFVCFLS